MACWRNCAAVNSNTPKKPHVVALDESRREEGPQSEGHFEARAEAEQEEKVSGTRPVVKTEHVPNRMTLGGVRWLQRFYNRLQFTVAFLPSQIKARKCRSGI